MGPILANLIEGRLPPWEFCWIRSRMGTKAILIDNYSPRYFTFLFLKKNF